MALENNLFSLDNFESTIKKYARQIGWDLYDLRSDRAILKFKTRSGNSQTVFVISFDKTLEFSCPSGLEFDNFDDIPHKLSSFLLRKNSEYKIGFWCIEEISDHLVFSIMHNAPMNLISVGYFESIIEKLIEECDDFEKFLEE